MSRPKKGDKNGKKITGKMKKSNEQEEEYVPGSVANFLGSGNLPKSVASESSCGGGLSSFFEPSVVKQTSIPSTNQIAGRSTTLKSTLVSELTTEHKHESPLKASTKKKSFEQNRLNKKAPATTKRKREDIDEDERSTKKKQKSDTQQIEEDPQVLARTVFVGNLPVSITKKELKGLFKIYGTIESIRFRSMGVADPSVSKKVAAIKQELNPKKKSFNAYLVFKEHQCAQAALKSNGKLVNKHHLRVDIAGNDKKHDMKRSLFVGNLPFDLADEDLRGHFEEFGTVEGVRIIRDKATGVGKGFGYILFEDSTSVQYALKAGGSKLKGRSLRIKRAVKKEKQKEPRGHITSRGRSGQRKNRGSSKASTGAQGQKRSHNASTGAHRKKWSGKANAGPRGQKQGGRKQFKGKKRQAKHGR